MFLYRKIALNIHCYMYSAISPGESTWTYKVCLTLQLPFAFRVHLIQKCCKYVSTILFYFYLAYTVKAFVKEVGNHSMLVHLECTRCHYCSLTGSTHFGNSILVLKLETHWIYKGQLVALFPGTVFMQHNNHITTSVALLPFISPTKNITIYYLKTKQKTMSLIGLSVPFWVKKKKKSGISDF